MTTARQIISDALTFGLNRLAPGETLDADLASMCLSALNSVADEMNGGGGMLWREFASTATVSASPAVLGTTWADVPPGTLILSATRKSGGSDIPMSPLTFAQYLTIGDKTATGNPCQYAQDGYANVYLYPVPTGEQVTIHAKREVSEFADLDTDYGMPKGLRSALAAFVAERMAPTLVGGVPPNVARDAGKARMALLSKMTPAIINPGDGLSAFGRFLAGA